MNKLDLKNNQGQMTLLLVSMLFTLTVSAFAVFQYCNTVYKVTALETRLDRCVGKKAIEFKKFLEKIETLNLEIKVARPLISAAKPIPPVYSGLIAASTVLFAIGELAILDQEKESLAFMIKLGCDGILGDLPISILKNPWETKLPDDLGPQPFEWKSGQEKKFSVRIQHGTHFAEAKVEYENQKWKTEWNDSQEFIGSIFN